MKPILMISAMTLALARPAGAEEFKFDASEFEKKTFEFSGYLEQKEEGQFQLDIKRLRNIFEGNKEELQDYRSLSDGEDLFKVLNYK